jgi:hypothetical protein
MSATSQEETVLRVSTAHNEPITLKLEGGGAVTIRVAVDSACTCTCQSASTNRVGSYIDRDVTTAAPRN